MQDFTGIAEKLVRAKENIKHLDLEIGRFFEEGEYCPLPEDNCEVLLEAIEYHKNRAIPPRFSVLAGEVIHHLRSCFDHIAWHFSVGATDEDIGIYFPVFKKEPVNADERRSFKRKIERIQNPDALRLIEGFQPYKTADPDESPLWIIHHLDIIEKHRDILACDGSGARKVPYEMRTAIEEFQRTHPELDAAQIANQLKCHGPLVPNVSFRDFGRRTIQPVIPGLVDLFNYTFSVVRVFEGL